MPARSLLRVPLGIHLFRKRRSLQNVFMIAFEYHRLTENVNRLLVSWRICATRPKILHPVMMLVIEFVEVRHVVSLRERIRSIRSWQSPNMQDMKCEPGNT